MGEMRRESSIRRGRTRIVVTPSVATLSVRAHLLLSSRSAEKMRYETKNEIVTTSLLFRVASTGKYDGMAGISRSAQRIAELETVEEVIPFLD